MDQMFDELKRRISSHLRTLEIDYSFDGKIYSSSELADRIEGKIPDPEGVGLKILEMALINAIEAILLK